MANWIFMFRPETYAKVQEHNTVGVRKGARKSFSRVKAGDRFLTYVSQRKQFDGYGVVTSEVFEDDANIFLDDTNPLADIYRNRCNVEFGIMDAGKDAGDVLWGLTPFEDLERTTPSNMIYCKGGYLEIPDADYDAIASWIDGESDSPWPDN